MAFNPQYKISQMAKDMGLKSKELAGILVAKGAKDVKVQRVLSEWEFNVLLHALTEAHQVDNICDYLDGKTCIPSRIAAIKEQEKLVAEKAAAAKAAAKAAAATRAAAAKREAAEKAAAEKVAAEKAESERIAAEKAAAKAAAAKAERDAILRVAEEKAAVARAKEELAEKLLAGRTADPAVVQRAALEAAAARAAADAAARKAAAAVEAEETDRRRASRLDRFDRLDRAREAEAAQPDLRRAAAGRPVRGRPTRDGQRPFGASQPSRGGSPYGRGDRGDRGDFVPSGPREHFQVQTVVRGQTPKGGTGRKPRGATRVVDTRMSGSVDLSKYDEKLDRFVSERVQEVGSAGHRTARRSAQQGRRPGLTIGTRRSSRKGAGKAAVALPRQPLRVSIPDEIVVGDLAALLKVTAGEVVKRLMMMGVMATINETVDYDTAYLVATELGVEATREVVVTIEERLFGAEEDSEEDLVPRAPVVCVMGHVDHGKTSLLDAIRHTSVTSGEAGGITQRIGAYSVQINGQPITFIDTPGHEAFTAMRARGAQATDIAVLVVAADDGVMPQTVEAINHAKAAGVDVVVAINKMDRPTAAPERIKQDLTKYDLIPEEWGGDVICVPVSALTGMGIDRLLESILLVAEVKELKANPNRRAKGLVIESRLDKGRGPVATVLVQNGTLHSGDLVIAGTSVGRVRMMTDCNGRKVKDAGPAVPVEIMGLSDVPEAGDSFEAVADERMARELADRRRAEAKEALFKASARAGFADLFKQKEGGVKDLNVIVKADMDGTMEAVKSSLEKLSNEEVRVRVIHAACGGITEGDVTFAAASGALIVGFSVRPDKQALDSAERQGVEIRTYRVIYECIEEIEAAMKGMLAPKFQEKLLGHAEVREAIHVPGVGMIAGSYIQDGKVTRTALIRVVRDGVVASEDKVASLRRFKDDVREVAEGYECGIGLDRFNDIKVGDILEAYLMEEIRPE